MAEKEKKNKSDVLPSRLKAIERVSCEFKMGNRLDSLSKVNKYNSAPFTCMHTEVVVVSNEFKQLGCARVAFTKLMLVLEEKNIVIINKVSCSVNVQDMLHKLPRHFEEENGTVIQQIYFAT